MESGYVNFLILLEKIDAKYEEIYLLKYKRKNNEFKKRVEKDRLGELQKYLEPELSTLEEMFGISVNSSVFLSGLLLIYYKYEDLLLPFVTPKIVLFETCFSAEDIVLFENEILELQEKEIVIVKDIDQKLIIEIDSIDRNIYDRYKIPYKEPEIELFNKTYELTETFIKHIINL